jgi:hypothetical protein
MRNSFSYDDTEENKKNRAEFLIIVVEQPCKKMDYAIQLKTFRDLLEQSDIMEYVLVEISLNIDAFFFVKVFELHIYHRIYYSFGNHSLD